MSTEKLQPSRRKIGMPDLEETPAKLGRSHRLQLPAAPAGEQGPVKAWHEKVDIYTYLPEPADPNPMFLEKRVYQGSSGRVYPLPYIDRIATEGQEHSWHAVHIENEYLRLMVLPEIGGRIHIGLDKINGYDFFYRQNVIKPALVGLAGPWISGGVEFNWPQHHRPATFMPVECQIERGLDGSATIWCSDHDPMSRMKGMHGVCLHPGKAYVELKVRLYNRTPYVQTFLWWANVAARVHERYQSFFPRDVQYVADHAKRAISQFPESQGKYYGVDYAERARTGVPGEERPRLYVPEGSYPANDLGWYANIPVPTSYMILGSTDDFFGGYDHAAQAGMVHVADHQIAPGKKQWTWGNHEFGYAWDRNLTEEDGPYVELMAGVYTDNQPDFSFLAPGETKEFSQFWYPIRKIGVPQTANLHAALSIRMEPGRIHLGVSATEDFPRAQILLERSGVVVAEWRQPIKIVQPLLLDHALPDDVQESELTIVIREDGRELLRYAPPKLADTGPPPVAEVPASPLAISSAEELYLTGLHLQQYRHATRSPEPYWREALRRDQGDSRANHALGLRHLHRGEFVPAERHFRRAIERLTSLNPNPHDGEAFYSLGLSLRFQHREQEAYASFYKATWNASWKSPAYYALAQLDLKNGRWEKALEHLRLSLRVNMDHLNARNLAVIALKRTGRLEEAEAMVRETRRLDRLDIWSRYLDSGEEPKDNRLRIDLALDYARAGLWDDAIALLAGADTEQTDGSAPMLLYMLAWCQAGRGDRHAASASYRKAAKAPPLYCFPNLLEEIEILQAAIAANPKDPRAPYYFGNLLYDRRRHEEAIELWELSAGLESSFATVWRNLAFAYFNIREDKDKARDAFDRAFAANPKDARVLYERDQLWKRIGESPEYRLRELERHPDLATTRDDLAAELATLYNQTGKPDQALKLLKARKFQPWEGGEGLVLGQWTRANLLMARQSLAKRDAAKALSYVEAALCPPENLGEARHLLANQSEIFYWAGVASSDLGDAAQAQRWWQKAAASRGDFQEMSVQPVSEMTYWSAVSLLRLGKQAEAQELLRAIECYSWELENQTPQIDYFATSLPAMLLFEEDLARRNHIEARFLRAQALLGLDRKSEAAVLLNSVLEMDRNQLRAADLLQDLMEQSATGPRN
jgi:tetratricopeptide (TPR) repeat protein